MLILYSTTGCHLCELAYDQIIALSLTDKVQCVDIAFDEVLFSRYGVTIPVLALHSQETQFNQNNVSNDDVNNIVSELFWPFNLDELQAWLKHNGINYH